MIKKQAALVNVTLFSLFWALQILISKLAFMSGAHPVTFTLQVASASYMSMMSMMTPVLVAVLAVWLLGEQLLWVQIFGGALTIAAGIIAHYSQANSKGRVA